MISFLNFLCYVPLSLTGHGSGIALGSAREEFVLLFLLSTFVSCLLLYFITEKLKFLKVEGYIIFFVFIVLLMASFGEPTLDDDIFRYIWDGYMTASGFNPSLELPNSSILSDRFPAEILEKISYGNYPTVYPPFAQWFFALLWLLFKGHVTLWCASFAFVSFLCVLILIQIAKHYSAPSWLKISLLLNPVFIKEYADSGHVDILGITLLSAAILIIMKNQKMAYIISSSLLLSMACLVKPIAFIFIPFLPFLKRKERLQLTLFVISFSVLFMFIYFKDFNSIKEYLVNLSFFQAHWVFNPGFAELVQKIVSNIYSGKSEAESWYLAIYFLKYISIIIMLSGFSLVYIHRNRAAVIGLLTLGVLLITQAVVNPWYLFWLWPLIFMLPWAEEERKCIRLSLPWIALPLFSSFSSYLFWINLADEATLRRIIWALWYSFLIYSLFIGKTDFRRMSCLIKFRKISL